MKRKNRKEKSKAKVLGDYKKVGKKFLPPLTHRLGSFKTISYTRHTLPELIWWHVIASQKSYNFMAKVAESIAAFGKGLRERDCWWAFISDYSRLSDVEVGGLNAHLHSVGILPDLQDSLEDFLNLYPKCPLSRFLDIAPTGGIDIEYLRKFENQMTELEDKRSRPAVLMQSQAVFLGFLLERFVIKKGLGFEDFPVVEKYPETERSNSLEHQYVLL